MKHDIACNPFVIRQTPESSFSYFAGSFEELVVLVDRHFDKRLPGDKPNSVKIVLEGEDARGFFSAVVECDEETVLESFFARRRGAQPDEQPAITTRAVSGKKLPAAVVEIVLYNKAGLSAAERTYPAQGQEDPVVVEAEWQIITVNARTTTGAEPLHPLTMARNEAARLALPEGKGGSPATYSADDYRTAILYWSRRAMFRGV